MELTHKFISTLTVEKRGEIADESYRHGKPRKGLMLQTNISGNHVFLYRRMVKGVRYGCTLGAFPELGLAAARELVDDINDHDEGPQAGIDALLDARRPASEDDQAEVVLTVDRLINRYIEKECEVHNRDWKNQELVLKRELKPYLTRPASALTEDDVLAVVQGCLDRGSPRTAQEIRKQIKSMYNWAMAKKRERRSALSRDEAKRATLRKAIPGITTNPADNVHAPVYKAKSHHLDDKALLAFKGKLAASTLRDDCKLILTIQLQTFCRVGEVAGMRWDELNLTKGIWTIPGERYKTGFNHDVYLSRQTAKLLRQIKKAARSPEFVFPMPLRSDKPMSARDVAKEINKARTSMKQHADFSSHSLRHSGATWLAANHCPYEVRERLLGHKIDTQGDMAARYNQHNYSDERGAWTQRWCDFLE